MKKLALASLLASVATCFAANNDVVLKNGKVPLKIESGDCSLTIGGKMKIEHYFDRNIALLNRCIPDEYNYFKNTFDVLFDFVYGKKTFDHEAVKAFTKLRHKGIWGRGAVYADSDAMSASPVKLVDSSVGEKHNHTSGKPLMWINEAWLQFSINAIADASPDRLHTIKLGWFPFELGRGIALGSVYGLNREGFGLNNYVEDKNAPGILLHGELKKDVLSYDLYYAKFESRSKSLGDTLANTKEQLIGHKHTPFRGVGKDNEAFAGRIKWKVLQAGKLGTIELEPYALYVAASDEKVKVLADSSVELGTIGMAVEHSTKSGFECGIEGAFNLGNQRVHETDQNKIELVRTNNGNEEDGYNNDGYLAEQFSHILDTKNKNALVTKISKEASQLIVYNDKTSLPNDFHSKPGRVLPSYTNQLRGYMIVADMAQKIEDYDLTLAAAYGFASGDENPHKDRKCKTHMGFIGMHESYSGKRVSSLMFLDEMRGNLSIPGAIAADVNSVDNNELSFTNLHLFGLSAKWSPTIAHKKCTINPNMLFFWRALAPHKFGSIPVYKIDKDTEEIICENGCPVQDIDEKTKKLKFEDKTTNELASRFIGTEFNVQTKVELLKDLELFGKYGMFIPGRMFSDVKGIPFKNSYGPNEYFDQLTEEAPETDDIKQQFRLGTDVAYHVNVGLNYSF